MLAWVGLSGCYDDFWDVRICLLFVFSWVLRGCVFGSLCCGVLLVQTDMCFGFCFYYVGLCGL